MGGRAQDPAALVRTYLQHDRLEDAARLAMHYLTAWQAQVCFEEERRVLLR